MNKTRNNSVIPDDIKINQQRRGAYINFLNRNIRVYEDRRRIFLELNIGSTSFLSFIILYFKDIFEPLGQILIYLGLIILFVRLYLILPILCGPIQQKI